MSRTDNLADSLISTLGRTLGTIRSRGHRLEHSAEPSEFAEHVFSFERMSIVRSKDSPLSEADEQTPQVIQDHSHIEVETDVGDAPPSHLHRDLQCLPENRASFDFGVGDQPPLDRRNDIRDAEDKKPFTPLAVLSSTQQLSMIALRGEPSDLRYEVLSNGDKTGQFFEERSTEFRPDNARPSKASFDRVLRYNDRPAASLNAFRSVEISANGDAREVVSSSSKPSIATHVATLENQSSARSQDNLAAVGEGQLVKVVRNETHLVVPRPVEQIASAILGKGQISGEANPAPMSQISNLPTPMAQTVRVLQVQLEPVELGMITVRLRLAANTLDVRVETDRQQTADLIRKDQDGLARLLHSAGFDIERLTIHAVAEPERSLSQATSHGPQPSVQQGALQAQAGGSNGEGRSGNAQQQRQQAPRSNTETLSHEPSDTTPQLQNGIYV